MTYCDCHKKINERTIDTANDIEGFRILYHNDLDSIWKSIRGKISLTLFITIITLFTGCFGAMYTSQQSSQKEIHTMNIKILEKISNLDKRMSIFEVKLEDIQKK